MDAATLSLSPPTERDRKRWMGYVKEWTSLSMPELLTMASRKKKDWKRISAESSVVSSGRGS